MDEAHGKSEGVKDVNILNNQTTETDMPKKVTRCSCAVVHVCICSPVLRSLWRRDKFKNDTSPRMNASAGNGKTHAQNHGRHSRGNG